jgi:transposase
MAAAVRLRAEGMSLRQIASEMACSEGTVRNDLARWARERPNVAAMVRKTTAQNSPPGAGITQPDYAPDSNIVELRRKA